MATTSTQISDAEYDEMCIKEAKLCGEQILQWRIKYELSSRKSPDTVEDESCIEESDEEDIDDTPPPQETTPLETTPAPKPPTPPPVPPAPSPPPPPVHAETETDAEVATLTEKEETETPLFPNVTLIDPPAKVRSEKEWTPVDDPDKLAELFALVTSRGGDVSLVTGIRIMQARRLKRTTGTRAMDVEYYLTLQGSDEIVRLRSKDAVSEAILDVRRRKRVRRG